MNWLKTVGSVALKVVGVATGLMPLVQRATVPNTQASVIEDKLVAGFNVIATAEQMFQAAMGPDAKTGSQKLKAATPFIAGIVQSIPIFDNKKPKDEAAFEQHCADLTSALANIFNDYGA